MVQIIYLMFYYCNHCKMSKKYIKDIVNDEVF